MPEQQRDLIAAIHAALKVGTPEQLVQELRLLNERDLELKGGPSV